MPKRTNLNDYNKIDKADDIERTVTDKRYGKRSKSKKNRRNRHYVKNMIKQMQIDLSQDDNDEQG
ncbi:MAG: hypothetical protein AAFO07_16600 [Bacteroidota bacterium]